MALALRFAAFVCRAVIVAALLIYLPSGLLALAAAGATLSDPTAGPRVGALIFTYMGVVVATLLLLLWRGSRAWSWGAALVVVALPLVAMAFAQAA